MKKLSELTIADLIALKQELFSQHENSQYTPTSKKGQAEIVEMGKVQLEINRRIDEIDFNS